MNNVASKFRLLALALLLSFGVVACGGGQGSEESGASGTEGVSDAETEETEDTQDTEVAGASEEDSAATGGATGGAATGGVATGGAATGGAVTGGDTGGVSGAAAGAAGAAAGAAGAAASALGGNETGGAATGGATGGAATGGATGGGDTGGIGDAISGAAAAAAVAVAGAAATAVDAVTGQDSDETGGAATGGATGGAATGGATGGAATGGAAAGQPGDQVTVNLSNEDNTAWVVTTVDGGDNVAELDTQNPTLNLMAGQRYVFETPSGEENPIDFRDESGTFLLAQGQPQGTLEDNSEVNFTDEGGSVAFTVTPELAEQLASYSSTTYPEMRGTVEVSQ